MLISFSLVLLQSKVPSKIAASEATPVSEQTLAGALLNQPTSSPAHTENEVNISGRWSDINDDTSVIMLHQDGHNIQMVTTTNGLETEGEGNFIDRHLDMTLSMDGVEVDHLRMILDAEGTLLQGTMKVNGKVTAVSFEPLIAAVRF